MSTKLSDLYINDAIDFLYQRIGIKELINYSKLRNLLKKGETSNCAKLIAQYLDLPIDVHIEYVSPKSIAGNYAAQVVIPSNLPRLGSTTLKNFPIHVKIVEDIIDYPEVFITVLAHEFSHVLLKSLGLNQSEDEIYTDLTAMILGFSNVIKRGREISEELHFLIFSVEKTTKYGYLDDRQFRFAKRKISTLLKQEVSNKFSLFHEVNSFYELLTKSNKIITRFRLLLDCIDNKPPKSVTPREAELLMKFHNYNFLTEFDNTIKHGEVLAEEVKLYIVDLHHYTQTSQSKVKSYSRNILGVNALLNKYSDNFSKYIKLISRYVGFKDRAKIFIKQTRSHIQYNIC